MSTLLTTTISNSSTPRETRKPNYPVFRSVSCSNSFSWAASTRSLPLSCCVAICGNACRSICFCHTLLHSLTSTKKATLLCQELHVPLGSTCQGRGSRLIVCMSSTLLQITAHPSRKEASTSHTTFLHTQKVSLKFFRLPARYAQCLNQARNHTRPGPVLLFSCSPKAASCLTTACCPHRRAAVDRIDMHQEGPWLSEGANVHQSNSRRQWVLLVFELASCISGTRLSSSTCAPTPSNRAPRAFHKMQCGSPHTGTQLPCCVCSGANDALNAVDHAQSHSCCSTPRSVRHQVHVSM